MYVFLNFFLIRATLKNSVTPFQLRRPVFVIISAFVEGVIIRRLRRKKKRNKN